MANKPKTVSQSKKDPIEGQLQKLAAQVPDEELVGVLERIPKFKRAASILMAYQGPFMPPHMVEEYGAIIQDAPERLLSYSEKEQQHRHAQDNKIVNRSLDRDDRLTWFAFIGSMVGFGLSAMAFIYGAPLAAVPIALGSMGTSAVAIFDIIKKKPKQ